MKKNAVFLKNTIFRRFILFYQYGKIVNETNWDQHYKTNLNMKKYNPFLITFILFFLVVPFLGLYAQSNREYIENEGVSI